jgi:23S rRNA pseudouridine1911/1915/1917 synthase
VVGDPTYARAPRDPLVREVAQALGRQALHARLLAFRHPQTGEELRFETAPPPDFQAALEKLRMERS